MAKQSSGDVKCQAFFQAVASVAISAVTHLLDGLEQESKMAAYSLYFTTVTRVIASFLSF